MRELRSVYFSESLMDWHRFLTIYFRGCKTELCQNCLWNARKM